MVGISLNNIPCVDPQSLLKDCVEGGMPTDWKGKANRYACPLGGESGYGHLLFRKSDYDLLTKTPGIYTLRMQSQWFSSEFPGIMFAGFPRNLTPGNANPTLMVEITDARSNLVKATNNRYTWRASASDDAPVNEKTWADVAEDLWNRCQFTQPFPGLPAACHGADLTIEQFDCHGFKVISVLEDLLQALGCVVAYDPTLDSFSIQYIAGDRENIVAFATTYRQFLVHDDTPYNPVPLFNVPERVRVLFPVWSDDPTTDPRMLYAKDVTLDLSAGLTSAKVRGTAILQDKQPLRLDADGAMLNQTLIDDRAAAVAAIYLDRLRTTTCQWPISRVYAGFIGGQRTPGLPGVMFDLVVWMDIGDGPMTAYLRQGIAGTGELYNTSSLPEEGLILEDHDPQVLYENFGVVRAGGIQPAIGRAQQNEGWWDDPAREVVRLVGSGLGSYMMRTQSLRYGEFAIVSTGGRGDLRGRLWRPWADGTVAAPTPDSTDHSGFAWIAGPEEAGSGAYPAFLLNQNQLDPFSWPKRAIGGDIYVKEANKIGLTVGVRYDVHQALNGGSAVITGGTLGEQNVWHTAICCGAEPGPPPPPVACGFQLPASLRVVLTNPSDAATPGLAPCFTDQPLQEETLAYLGEIGVTPGLSCASIAAAANAILGYSQCNPFAFSGSYGFCGNVSPWTHVWMSTAAVSFPNSSDVTPTAPAVFVLGMFWDNGCVFRLEALNNRCEGNLTQLRGIASQVLPIGSMGDLLWGGSAFSWWKCDGSLMNTPPTTLTTWTLGIKS